jgi:predicted PurR-regulated permease PerM
VSGRTPILGRDPDATAADTRVEPVLSARAVLRAVLVIVAVVITLYVLWLLRKPIGWALISVFLAVALSGPVNLLNRRMRRGLAIATVYFALLLVPIAIAAAVIPPVVTQVNNLVDNLPRYAHDTEDFFNKNPTLRKLERNYHITEKLQQEASKLPAHVGDAATVLSDVGLGVVNSLFALFTILVLTAFLLGSGRLWVDKLLELQPPQRRDRLRVPLDHMARAVGNYVGGALTQATVAAVSSFIVLEILGVPFAPALAIIIFLGDLIPLVGATIGAVLVGVVTLFSHFPTATIVWTIWSIAYQQIENNLIQPQIQKRAVDVHPFVVLFSVLCGATLLGVVGALVAIPIAASIQIVVREWWEWRRAEDLNRIAPGGAAPVRPPPPEET